MAKFSGVIGFGVTDELVPGVYDDVNVIEKPYYGEYKKNVRKLEGGNGVVSNFQISTVVEVYEDNYLRENLSYMKYVGFHGLRWNVESIEISYPKLILTIGGVYVGPVPQT